MSKNAPSRRPTGRPRGRPPVKVDDQTFWAARWGETAQAICEAVANGTSLAAACGAYRDLTPAIFLRWVELHADVRRAWDSAKTSRAAGLFESVVELADELRALASTAKDAGAKRQCLVEAAGLMRWGASKLDPANYGDRPPTNPGVAIQINTSLPIRGADPLDDGSGSFTVRVAPNSALEPRIDEGAKALPVKVAGDPPST